MSHYHMQNAAEIRSYSNFKISQDNVVIHLRWGGKSL